VTLSEDFGEGDFDRGSYSSKQAVFHFTAALGRMDVCLAALGIDYSDIRNTERQIVGDFRFEITPARSSGESTSTAITGGLRMVRSVGLAPSIHVTSGIRKRVFFTWTRTATPTQMPFLWCVLN